MAHFNYMNKIIKFIFPDLALLLSVYEIYEESEWVDKADDVIFVVLALIAFILPKVIKNKTPRFLPILFLILALVVKIVAFFIENENGKADDHDLAIIIFMALGIIINLGAALRRTRK